MSPAQQAAPWDGVPQNPDRDGAHWIGNRTLGHEYAVLWCSQMRRWHDMADQTEPRAAAKYWVYFGPCTPPPPAAAPEITQEQALLAAEQRGMDVGLQWAAYIASMACLVPPDGGSPSEEEAAVCEEAERRILSLVGRKPSVVDLRHYERKAADIRAALAGVPRE